MQHQLVTIVGLKYGKFKVHAAGDDLFPFCNSKKRGTPVIPGVVTLNCNRCRDIIIKRLATKPEKPANPNPF